ncbi:type II toxin-antitoxin system HigB family toxin [Prosthecomicrobium hirschii]|uniref:type II toxin-antitoxin system HigB family toxin n=1 Tax=Prosthecodimorpha hirschii TaxID=665126 RepID=UPI0009F94FF0|nr:type II toxin-antitoxin system HigB family toxin [Prosthecomicrobium hirschii]MCW1842064.1 type II toxin-antitoxin system HigB family toxin [Prosthecomicrobium hirschii]
MRVIAKRTLQEFWERPGRSDAEQPLKAWFHEAAKATWHGPAEIKRTFASASIVADNRVVFNIAGNKYRLVVHINYGLQIVLVKFVGTHAEYDDIDVRTVGGGGRNEH